MHVLSVLPDYRMGGPQRRSLMVAERLAERGVVTSFVIPRGGNKFYEVARSRGFECIKSTLPRPRSPKKIIENARFVKNFSRSKEEAKGIIQKVCPDIVHVNGPLAFQSALAAHRTDTTLVWHFNDVLTPWPLSTISSHLAQRWADKIVVSAKNVNNKYGFDADSTCKIYPPVDINEYYNDGTDISQDDGTFRIGTVGNINSIKGYEYLIEAFAKVNREIPNSKLYVVGSVLDSQKKYYNKLNRICNRLSVDSCVEFLGYRDDVPTLLTKFDLFAMPSTSETGPMTLLEAMAAGRPCVTTDVGVVPELFKGEDAAWVVPPKNADLLSDALLDAIKNPSKRRKRATRANHIVENNCSVEACADRHYRLYSNCR